MHTVEWCVDVLSKSERCGIYSHKIMIKTIAVNKTTKVSLSKLEALYVVSTWLPQKHLDCGYVWVLG